MSQLPEMSQSQLRWRCRRGMLELDLLLTTFIENEYDDLSREGVALFSDLLEYQDQVLFDLLLEKEVSSDSAISDLVNKIRYASSKELIK